MTLRTQVQEDTTYRVLRLLQANPEQRCYTEASSPEQTLAVLQQHLSPLSSTQPA